MRPCPIIDNPEKFQKIVEETGAYPTQANGVTAAQLCQPLVNYSKEWAAHADRIWTEINAQQAQRQKKTKAGA